MQTIMVYSESGGATKTTTAVSLAMTFALQGKEVVLIDLDPRAATTKWLNVEPSGEGLHVGAILGNSDVEGWAQDLAVQSSWSPKLRVIPSARSLSTLEGMREDYADLRLASSLIGLEADVVIVDCPNRQGGLLTLAALNASDTVVYAAQATEDGVDGVVGAQNSVSRFLASRKALGAPVKLKEAGIVVGAVSDTIPSRIERASLDNLADLGILLTPFVPSRAIVKEMRVTHEWFGNFTKGLPVAAAYEELAGKVVA